MYFCLISIFLRLLYDVKPIWYGDHLRRSSFRLPSVLLSINNLMLTTNKSVGLLCNFVHDFFTKILRELEFQKHRHICSRTVFEAINEFLRVISKFLNRFLVKKNSVRISKPLRLASVSFVKKTVLWKGHFAFANEWKFVDIFHIFLPFQCN